MPSTLTGVLIFLALLIPGIVHVIVREINGRQRRESAFRESAGVIAGSVAAELVALLAVLPISSRWLDVPRLLTRPEGYWLERPVPIAWTAILALALATLIAAAAATPTVVRLVRGHDARFGEASSWTVAFDRLDIEGSKHVGVILDDGSYVGGRLLSWNDATEEDEDRDLILEEPINYRPAGATSAEVKYGAHVVVISAAKIKSMFVTYMAPGDAPTTTSTGQAGEAEEASARTAVSAEVETAFDRQPTGPADSGRRVDQTSRYEGGPSS